MKVISCGVIVVNKNNPKQILGCKPFNKKENRVDIPKGKMEEGESYIDTVIRETREETGIHLVTDELEDLGLFKYRPEKDLYLFTCKLDLDLSTLKCESTFLAGGRNCPEVESYEWIDIDSISERFYISLVPILTKILK